MSVRSQSDFIPQDMVQRLSALGRKSHFNAGEVVWTAGSPIDHLLIIVDGRIRVVREGGGRQHVIHTEGPGGMLGEVPFYTGGPAPATAIAVVPTSCVVLTHRAIESAIAADPSLAWMLLARLAGRVRTLVDRVDRLALRSATARLAEFLLEHPDTRLTQSALAEELGTVREVVVRALRTLRERGVITSVGRGRYRIRDAASLRALAQSDVT